MAIAVARNPLGASQMTLISIPSARRFRHRINVKHNTRDFVPIRVVRFGIEETRIRDGVLLVIRCQGRLIRR
jgi:hypothetical protein